jgi:tRNA (guanine26-N2/guanine27-N2)-dimethyltransferase
MADDLTWHSEGKVTFQVGNAFYRSDSQTARDLGILAAAVYRSQTHQLRVLDAMAGCGVRSLRYWQESKADWVWTNEGNPEVRPTLLQNLATAIAANRLKLTHLDANRVFFDCYNRQDYYDLVDVDCFGSAAPYLSTSLWAIAIGGLLYLTSTDGRTATGHLPNISLQVYAAYARSHPAAHEQGLRLLIGSIHQQAATKGLGIQPVFSFFSGQTYRVMLRLVAKPALTLKTYGFLGYCHHCGNYQVIQWQQLGRVTCPHDDKPLSISGPLWLGELHDRHTLQQFIQQAHQWNWMHHVSLLELMQSEVNLPPYFFRLGEIGKRGKMDIPKRSHLITALQEKGYQASPSHINAQAIKTNADLQTCIAAARQNFKKSS